MFRHGIQLLDLNFCSKKKLLNLWVTWSKYLFSIFLIYFSNKQITSISSDHNYEDLERQTVMAGIKNFFPGKLSNAYKLYIWSHGNAFPCDILQFNLFDMVKDKNMIQNCCITDVIVQSNIILIKNNFCVLFKRRISISSTVANFVIFTDMPDFYQTHSTIYTSFNLIRKKTHAWRLSKLNFEI